MEENGLEADELKHGEEHADEGALGVGVVQEAAEGDGFFLRRRGGVSRTQSSGRR